MKRSSKRDGQVSSDTQLLAEKVQGLLLPVPTPFKENGDVHADALRANIKKWNASGIAGYVALGSTGERVNLDEREYQAVIKLAREEVPSDLAFIVGAGQQSTRGSIDEIKKVAAAGADAVLVITPHYYRSSITQQALISHFKAVADAARIPVILYSMPALTGITIEPDTVAELSKHPNIVGVKDSSADVDRFKQTVHLVNGEPHNAFGEPLRASDEFAVLTGNGTVLYDALKAGADGGILAVGCVAPWLCLEIMRAFRAGENERAAKLQEKLTPLARAVTTDYGIGGLKAALDMVGYTGGHVRAPLRSPNEEARAEIARLIEAFQTALAEKSTMRTDVAPNLSESTSIQMA